MWSSLAAADPQRCRPTQRLTRPRRTAVSQLRQILSPPRRPTPPETQQRTPSWRMQSIAPPRVQVRAQSLQPVPVWVLEADPAAAPAAHVQRRARRYRVALSPSPEDRLL